MTWHRILRYVSLLLVCVTLALVVFSECIVSGSAPGWLRMVGVEIQAACRDAGTQWMVVVCLVSYFVAFVVLERRILPQKSAENAKGKTAPRASDSRPQISISAFLAFFRGRNSDVWLWVFVGLVLLRYAVGYESASKSLQVVVLLTGIVIGKGMALWVSASRRSKSRVQSPESEETESQPLIPSLSPSDGERVAGGRVRGILCVLVFLLACASLWQPEYGMEFQYRGQRRWTGPWDNPNIYGLLMGVGAVLAVGLLVQVASSKFQVSSLGTERVGDAESVGGANVLASRLVSSLAPPEVSGAHGVTRPSSQRSCGWCVSFWRTRRFLLSVFLLSTLVLCGFGLLKSYSRGAWLGTCVALAYLIGSWVWRMGAAECGTNFESRKQKTENSCLSWIRTNWFLLSVLVVSILVLCFWNFRHTERLVARRAFSVGNVNDFSWRNRVAAWEGALQMMAEKPWLGSGWNQADRVYDQFYRVPRVAESAAIQMNDFFTLGTAVGVPALLCFVAYLLLSFRGVRVVSREPIGLQTSELRLQIRVAASAGALVPLIGFWFDGGMFNLSMGVVFWVLLGLGRND